MCVISYKTAIKRNSISGPTKWLLKNKLLNGRVLDYGCGYGYDADKLNFDKYDPYYFPEFPTGKYDVIFCNYVLNVIPDEKERSDILDKIKSLLKPDGYALISVRRDLDNIDFEQTSKGFQGLVYLDLPILVENKQFAIYILV